MASRLHIPDKLRLESREVIETLRLKGQFVAATVAACVYAVCRKHNLPVNMQEIGNSMTPRVKKNLIAKRYERIRKKIYPSLPQTNISPDIYLVKIAKSLKKSDATVRSALKLIQCSNEVGNLASGRHPATLAAAAFYLACLRHGEPSTQSEIASAAGLSDDKSLRRVIKLLQLIDIKHPS